MSEESEQQTPLPTVYPIVDENGEARAYVEIKDGNQIVVGGEPDAAREIIREDSDAKLAPFGGGFTGAN